jgi:hypothetical protein
MDPEVLILEESKAINVDGLSVDRRRNWKQLWENCTGRTFGRCSFFGYANEATDGDHFWLQGRSNNNFQYIAPVCRTCNSQTENRFYADMKKNTIYVRIPTHDKF